MDPVNVGSCNALPRARELDEVSGVNPSPNAARDGPHTFMMLNYHLVLVDQ